MNSPTTSVLFGLEATSNSLVALSHSRNPDVCRAVSTAYFMPACFIAMAQPAMSRFEGL